MAHRNQIEPWILEKVKEKRGDPDGVNPLTLVEKNDQQKYRTGLLGIGFH